MYISIPIKQDTYPRITYIVMNLSTLVHIREREDNYCQEEGRVKSVWREIRIFGGN